MPSIIRLPVVWSLLLCLVLVNGAMAAPSVVHSAKHGNHHAGTHSTGLCAWLCTAGQGIETASIALDSIYYPVEQVLELRIDQQECLFFSDIFLRGPPASAS